MLIAPSIASLARPIDSVTPLTRNPRKGDVDSVAHSLRTFGQQIPIVVSTDGVILKGNHTHAAAVTLGATEIAVAVSQWSAAEMKAQAFVLADNRSSDTSRYDNEILVEMLEEVARDPEALLADTLYTPEDLDRLLALTAPGPRDDGDGDDDMNVTECPNCGHQW